MDSILDVSHIELSYQMPSKEDYDYFKQLFKMPIYKYVKTNWTIDDIIEGKDLLPFSHKPLEPQQEFVYSIRGSDQQLIGFVKGYYPIAQHHLWIQILAVNFPHLHQGYGKSIMQQLILTLLENNTIEHIYLTCHNQNIIGGKFWKSLGFSKIFNIKSTHSLYKADLRSLTCIPNHLKP